MLIPAMALQLKLILRFVLALGLLLSLTILYMLQTTVEMSKQSAANDGPSPVSPQSRSIEAVERHCLRFNIGGHLFNELGRSGVVGGPVTSCLVHSFSPYIEREAARRFLDPARDNVYFANSPAITWDGDELVLVARIWLDRERYEAKSDWPSNQFADNWLYTQRFDARMKPVSSGSIIGLPSAKQWWVGDGPIEPRLVRTTSGQLIISFNVAMAFEQNLFMDYTVWFDMQRSLPVIPFIDGGTPMVNATEENDMPRDKHWMAFVEEDNYIHFVHNLDPLRIMRCTLDGQCAFVQRDEQLQDGLPRSGFIFRDTFSHLRGGTPFELYKWPYYVSVAHTTMYKSTNNHRYYSSHLVVLCVRPTYRIVYVSEAIQLHRRIYQSAPMVRAQYIDDGFLFPVGLVIESDDSLMIGGHVNDYSSVIVRLKGVKGVLSRVVKLDELRKTRHGPPIGYIQQHIHDILVNSTHVSLVHQI